tara:strand:- start:18466 stop:19830 length:1365 start_codon:yes stop_codon:yes gene_type:complete
MRGQAPESKKVQRWFVRRDDKEIGPFSSKQIRSMARDGRITLEDLLRTEDSTNWVKANTFNKLFATEQKEENRATSTSPPISELNTDKKRGERSGSPKIALGIFLLLLALSTIKLLTNNGASIDSSSISNNATVDSDTSQLSKATESDWYREEKWGLVGRNGDVIVPYNLDDLWDISSGYAIFKENGKYGLLDKSGKIVTKATYESGKDVPLEKGGVTHWYEKFSNLEKKYLDSGGMLQAYDDKRGIALVRGILSGEWNLISEPDKVIARLPKSYAFRDMKFDAHGWIRFSTNDSTPGYGMVDTKGQIVIRPKYGMLSVFSDGLAAAEALPNFEQFEPNNKPIYKVGYIDQSEQWKIEPKWRSVAPFSEGLAGVQDTDTEKWGFIDTSGNLVIDYQFDQIDSFFFSERGAFVEGRAGVCIDKKWGFIDKTGHWILKPEFREIQPFVGGVARVKK